MNFGQKIRYVREKAGLTTDELAKKLNVSQSYISHVENNRRLLGRDRIIALAKAVNTPVEFFLRDDIKLPEELREGARMKQLLAESPYADYFVAVDKALAAEITPEELEKAIDFIRQYKHHPHKTAD